VLWRLNVVKKYFVFDDDNEESPQSLFDLSKVPDVRERQIVQQLIASVLVNHSPGTFLVIEEGVPGEWLSDILALARRRGARIIYVSQTFPPMQHNFETILFTPYISNPRTLPLPVNPALDRGVWWVGGLGVHRLKHVR